MLGVPRREQRDALRLGKTIEVGNLRKAGGWRLFQQAMKAGGDALARNLEARAGRRGDRDSLQAVNPADQFAPVREALFNALSRTA